MKIYSTFRRVEKNDRMKWTAAIPGMLGAWRRHRQVSRNPRRIWNGKIKILILCSVLAVSGLAIFNATRFSFAYNPPLSSGLLIRPVALSTFQSVPLTDPDEFEPDSMDRIEEVVEEIKPEAASLTRKELRFTKYRIKSGDSVWDIARRNGIRTGTLLWANSSVIQDGNTLPVGKQIMIPNMDAIEVPLKPGESISSVASRFSVNTSEILKYNAVKDVKALKPGDKLYIPNPNFTFQNIQKALAKRPDGLIWPASYRIVNSEFGFRMHPIHKRKIFHEGIDIGGGRGSTVYAAGDGRVSFVGWMRGYGKIIVMRHQDGITTRYAHLSNTRVIRGQRVEQGQMIGAIGATGLATGPNLHFEVRKNGLPQDPLTYLRRK